MNILFLFVQYPEYKDGNNLHKDLPDEFTRQGDGVFVATIRERRLGLKTSVSEENGRNVLRVRTGNMFNDVSRIEKALVMLTMHKKITAQIKKHWGEVKFDLIVGSTPYTANHQLIRDLKKHFKCPAFLILWDLFPQNAWDLGLIRNRLIFNLLKYREVKSLENFDLIGCMSDGNMDYVAENYTSIDKDVLTNFPLWASSSEVLKEPLVSRLDLGFHEDDFILVFGGNMGIPQNLCNVIMLANEVKEIKNIKFLFIGHGSEAEKIKSLAQVLDLSNVMFLAHMARSKYQEIMLSCDIGLVSLHPDFTIPNFPSKTMDYLKYNLPILASLDDSALADYGKFIEKKAKVGLCSHADDMEAYKRNLLRFYNNRNFCTQLAKNCSKVTRELFNIKTNVEIIKAYF